MILKEYVVVELVSYN